MAKKYTELGETLRRLLFDRNMRAVDLSREVNLPPPTIHRLLTGKSTRPYNSSLKPIAEYFGITIENLLTGNKSEEDSSAAALLEKNLLHYLPLLAWESLTTLEQESPKHTLPFLGPIGKRAFATLMPDFSMEPIFAKGSFLIFDPDKVARDRAYILVHLSEGKSIVLRQLIVDGNARYLKSLNSDLHSAQIRACNTEDKILGILIECRTQFHYPEDR